MVVMEQPANKVPPAAMGKTARQAFPAVTAEMASRGLVADQENQELKVCGSFTNFSMPKI